jgi:hypothetical protein
MTPYSVDQAIAPSAQFSRTAPQMSFEPTALDELGHCRLLYRRTAQIVELFSRYQITYESLRTDDVAKPQGRKHNLGETSNVDDSISHVQRA